MFATACGLARRYTRPVIVSTRAYNGYVSSGCGAFVVVNHQGWIVTVAHLWQAHHAAQAHQTEIKNYKDQLAAITDDATLTQPEKDTRVSTLHSNPQWITNVSFWWSWDNVNLVDVRPFPEADLILARLEPFDPAWITNYPVFKDPAQNFDQGTSLCRIGFPFHTINTRYHEKENKFEIDSASLPPPFFPIEGIFTRNILGDKTKDGKYQVKMIETSSPGLRGQSGGPIFDCHGSIWGVQSRTKNLPLGFSPKIKRGEVTIEENQFLNVGEGIHVELVLAFLREHKVPFQMSVN